MRSPADPLWRAPGEVFRRLEAAYPEEGCGFIRASGHVHPVRNAAADPRTAFAFGGEDLLRYDLAFEDVDPPVIVYHGHPDAPPTFSPRDAAGALLDGEPIYPVHHLIVEVLLGRVHRYALYGLDAVGVRLIRSGLAGDRP